MNGYKIRAATPEDMPLVLDSWAKSFRLPRPRRVKGIGSLCDDTYVDLGGDRKRLVAPNIWAEMITTTVDRIAGRSAIAVAYHDSDPTIIVGWIAFGESEGTTTIHYVWTRPQGSDSPGFRREGIASSLLAVAKTDDKPARASFLTPDGRELLCGASAPME